VVREMKPLAAPFVARLTFLQRKMLAAPSRAVCECFRIGCRARHRFSLPLSRWRYIEKTQIWWGSTRNASAEVRDARHFSSSIMRRQKVIVEDNCLFGVLIGARPQ